MDKMTFEKNITIDMPQMAIEALSENWLFKETGNFHWEMICKGLNTKSYDLKDDLGNRLYATFVRISLHCSGSLNNFKENETLNITADIGRFGNSLYKSKIQLKGNNEHITLELLTSFSVRYDSDNSKLVKSQPADVANSIFEFESLPAFANEYRLMKKGLLNEIRHHDYIFEIKKESIFDTNYIINPYYDLNGVGLLYFAAFPTINDFCEAKYFNANELQTGKWEQTYYTVMKDVFYFANCNIYDEIIYKLHSIEHLTNNQIKLCSSLYRKSDNTLMANILTIKQRKFRS